MDEYQILLALIMLDEVTNVQLKWNFLAFSVRAVPGKTALGGWNGNQLKFGGWGVFPGI